MTKSVLHHFHTGEATIITVYYLEPTPITKIIPVTTLGLNLSYTDDLNEIKVFEHIHKMADIPDLPDLTEVTKWKYHDDSIAGHHHTITSIDIDPLKEVTTRVRLFPAFWV